MTYALITGATKGIGKAIAEELAKRKTNVLLIARSSELLRSLCRRFTDLYGVEADFFAVDLSETGAALKVYNWCTDQHYEVNILINNAGFGLCGSIEKYPLQEHLDMVQVNINAPLQLIYLFLPQLKSASKAHIMNIASTASYQAVPGLNIYAATKAFILNFTRGLRHELRNTNISVTAVSPGPTDTDFISRAHISNKKALKLAKRLNMSPEKVASLAINGMNANKAEVITGLVNRLNTFFVWLLPKTLSERAAAIIYGV
jgi:short-subunit dehydrogenase